MLSKHAGAQAQGVMLPPRPQMQHGTQNPRGLCNATPIPKAIPPHPEHSVCCRAALASDRHTDPQEGTEPPEEARAPVAKGSDGAPSPWEGANLWYRRCPTRHHHKLTTGGPRGTRPVPAFPTGARRRRPTDEPQRGLRQGERAGVEQQGEVVRAVLQGQQAEHGQQEARVGGGAQAGSRRVLIGDGLQGDGLDP